MDYGVIDARVSTELQEKGYSLDGQVRAGLAYAEKFGIFVPPEYCFQESHTGTDIDRPTIMKIRQVIKDDKRVKYIIVYSLDRLARTALGLLLLEKEFRKAGIRVVYIKYEFDDTPEGQLQKQIYAAFSEFEKATITHRVAKGKRDKVAGGQFLGMHNPPYGYLNDVHITGTGADRNTTKANFMKVNPEEARILKYIFEWVAYGDETTGGLPVGATTVARKLTELKVPSPFVIRCPKAKKRKTPIYQWSVTAVLGIVRNPVYCAGIWYYNKSQRQNGATIKMPKDQWIGVSVPTIIEPELWRAANHQLDLNSSRSLRPHHPYLLTARVTCAVCGRNMTGTTSDKGTYFYLCSGYHPRNHAYKREDCCKTRYVNASALEGLVWNWLYELFSNPEQVIAGLTHRQSEQKQQHALSLDRLESLNEELSRINSEMNALMSGFARQGFDPDSPAYRVYSEKLRQYDSQAKWLEEERKKIEQKLSKVVISDDALARAKRSLQAVDTVFKNADPGKRRTFLDLLDVNVVVKAPQGVDDILVEANCCIKSSGVMHLAKVRGNVPYPATNPPNAQEVGEKESAEANSYVRT